MVRRVPILAVSAQYKMFLVVNKHGCLETGIVVAKRRVFKKLSMWLQGLMMGMNGEGLKTSGRLKLFISAILTCTTTNNYYRKSCK